MIKINSENKVLEQIDRLLDEAGQENSGPFPKFSKDALAALYALAYHLYQSGKYQEGKQIFCFMSLQDPFDRRYWMGQGACLQMLKNYSAALECYSVAATQCPDDPYVHIHAADCFFALGQVETALKTLDSALATAKKMNHQMLQSQLQHMLQSWREVYSNSLSKEPK